ncbi:MAG: hypothetical protein KC912_24335 [Proteobacteria bacterium]|nr:hypothetical protein [Pseudomonadota bacterium]
MRTRWPWVLAALVLATWVGCWVLSSRAPQDAIGHEPGDPFYDSATAQILGTSEACGLPVAVVCEQDVCAYAGWTLSPTVALSHPGFAASFALNSFVGDFESTACGQASLDLFLRSRVYEARQIQFDPDVWCGAIPRKPGRSSAESQAHREMAEVACAEAAALLDR